jgi:hypothetical protein
MLLGCNPAEEPHFDIVGSNQSDAMIAANCMGTKSTMGPIATGTALVAIHTISSKIDEAPEGLEIVVETVCETIKIKPKYDGAGRAAAPFSAPPGAECGIIATATVANSTIRCEIGKQSAIGGCPNEYRG